MGCRCGDPTYGIDRDWEVAPTENKEQYRPTWRYKTCIYKGVLKMNYIEQQFKEIEILMDKHKKTLKQRSTQKEFYSEFHRLLYTKYIVHHQEFVEFKETPEYHRMSEKEQDSYINMRKETPDRYKKYLDNYEKNRCIDGGLHKALDGLYNSEKVNAGYAFILKCNLISDWGTPGNKKNAKHAYNARKKYC